MEPARTGVESAAPDEVAIGIDFGMTYSGGAYFFRGPGGALNFGMLPRRRERGTAHKFPTRVFVSQNRRTIAVGDEVWGWDQRTEGKVYELFKRLLGSAPDATFLATEVLKEIKRDIDAFLPTHGLDSPRTKKRYVFTYPGTWNDRQQCALKDVITAAEFPDDYRMLDEATATAIGAANVGSHSEILGNQETIFICDVGGGTTDFALVQATADGQVRERHAIGGDQHLGMSNLDKLIALSILRKMSMVPRQMPVLDEPIVLGQTLEQAWADAGSPDDNNRAWKSLLLKQSEDLKKRAFTNWQEFTRDGIRPDGVDGYIELTKADLQPFVTKMLNILAADARAYLAEAARVNHVRADAIRYVIVGGGGSALPGIHEALQAVAPHARVIDDIASSSAMNLVAYGGVFYALLPTVFGRHVARSYGIRVARPAPPPWHVPEEEMEPGGEEPGGDKHRLIPYYPYYERILRRGDLVRAEPIIHEVKTIRANLDSVTFQILCGEDDNPLMNTVIGPLTLPLPRRAPRGYSLTCGFAIGQDGLLEVTATDPRTGNTVRQEFPRVVVFD